MLAGFVYEGRTGTITPEPLPASGAGIARSPSGRWITQQRNVWSGGIIDRTDLWLVDTNSGQERLLYSPPPEPSGARAAQPNPAVAPYVFRRTEYVGTFSPDERYLVLWQIAFVSASADADGRPFVVIDVASGALIELGFTLYSAYAWRAPHTLAYVAGGGRETWLSKTLRVWTPESGTRDATAHGEIGLAPTWGPDGRLWFVTGLEGQYDRSAFFSGRGIGDRSIVALDLATGVRALFPRTVDYADEGVRLSDDGRAVLVLRRKLAFVPNRSTTEPDSWVELWSGQSDGSSAHRLVRLSAYAGFGYYGRFDSLAKLDWVR
jgi:hypothetical protein